MSIAGNWRRMDENEKLQAENERLRAALREILDDPEMTGCQAMAIATRAIADEQNVMGGKE
jgi:regulator of replication initiation timing